MHSFVLGPLIWIAFLLFLLGLVFQVVQFFTLTKRKDPVFLHGGGKPEGSKKKGWIEWVTLSFCSLRRTVWRTHPLMTVMTSIFHFFLIVTPFFVLGHNILLRESLGVSFLSLSEFTTDVLTAIIFLCAAFFLYRRLFVAKVRVISTGVDYLMLLITLAPFLTGYAAYHQWLNYDALIFLHILAAEVMLITLPFTKLGHMLFFFLYRFFIGSEYSFSQGTRAW